MSKVIGATMLAELVIEGKLDPDAPIKKYMSRLPRHYQHITARQLLSHTSGMPHYQIKDYDIYDKHYDSAINATSTLKSRRLLTRPGSKYKYSTHGYTLAGALYENITKNPLTTAIPSFIKRWAGRSTPAIEDILNLPVKASLLYAYSSGVLKREPFGEKSYSVFGAGLSATANDLAHFGHAVLDKSANNREYKKLMFTPTLTSDGNTASTTKYQVGFGWRIGKDTQGNQVYHHAGATPGARSILVLYPEQELSIAILANTSWVSSIDEMAYTLANLFLDQAKPIVIENVNQYTAHYNNKSITGDVKCSKLSCYIINETTPYSAWQNQFNNTKDYINDWPIFSYSTQSGTRILMVGKTGIRTLYAKNNQYQAAIFPDKNYYLKLITNQ